MTAIDPTTTFATELGFWRDSLNRYTPEQLADGASDDDWSIGQLYAHLAGSAVYFHLPMAARALASTDAPGIPTERGQHVLSGQPVPPVKVPASPTYTPHQPASADFIRTQLDGAEAAFAATAAKVVAAPEAVGTAAHPSMGHLTAAQWLAIVPAHYHSHHRQLARLEARLGVAA